MILVLGSFLFGLLNDFLSFPRFIRYGLDAIWVSLLVLMAVNLRGLNVGHARPIILLIICFVLYTAIMYIGNFQNILYYLWGSRNNFRFFVAFTACALFLLPDDIEDAFKLIDKLFWINAIVSIIQYVGFDIKQDFLGGLFGVETGVNGYTNIFFCIIAAKSALSFLEGRESAWSCGAKWMTALLIAALAELKFFYVECVVIIVLATLFTKFTWKKLAFILFAFIGIACAASLLASLFPYFSDFFSLEWFYQESSAEKGYTYKNDINRLTAIAFVNENWLTNPVKRVFGLGLGNCDTATFSIVNTPFFEKYGDMHYSWLSYAFMYLECGAIGLVFFFSFFVMVFWKATRIQKYNFGEGVFFCQLARIMAIICCMIAVYNNSLRVESGYMAYFVLAIPFVYDRYARVCGTKQKECMR